MKFSSFVFLVTTAMTLVGCDARELLAVGDTITVEGYVMDQYCLDLGVLMDKPSIVSLKGPDQHCQCNMCYYCVYIPATMLFSHDIYAIFHSD
jgi:uncharacterized protein YcfL